MTGHPAGTCLFPLYIETSLFERMFGCGGVGEACAAAQRDGKMRNVQLSGESYTDEPLTSQVR